MLVHFAKHQWTVLLVVFGIVFTILLLTIGFFKTLLLILVVGVCMYIGIQLDKKDSSVKDFFKKIFSKGDNK